MASELQHRLEAHIQALATSTTAQIDVKLIDDAGLALSDQLSAESTMRLVQNISGILQSIQQDPSPLTELLERLLHGFTFADVLAFEPPIDFATGLQPASALVSINMLMLYLLQKAQSPAGVATIAGRPELVRALITVWLCTADVGVATRAEAVLTSFLTIDKPADLPPGQVVPPGSPGQGLMWKRLFQDPDVYDTLFTCCDLKCAGPQLSKRQITLAQARLLEALPKWANLDWSCILRSHHVNIEQKHGLTAYGLLEFASRHMIDTRDDVLTYVCLLEFYTHLIAATRSQPSKMDGMSVGLQYLIQAGLHNNVEEIYLGGRGSDPLQTAFLYGPAARYLGVYASQYSSHYMRSTLPANIERRLYGIFDQSATRWSHSEPPRHDLDLLANLPRISLLPGQGGSKDWSSSPLLRLPCTSVPPEVLETLAAIFHGPAQEVISFPQASPLVDDNHEEKVKDAAAARTLYYRYLAQHRTLWKDVVAHAETVALLDRALAAINLLTAVITANWSAEVEYDLPSDIIATPESGVIAILSPPALEYVIPYLNRPAQTFSNLVGGRGDAESSAYKIAMAKFDALRALHSRLGTYLERQPDLDLQAVLVTLEKRLAEGPMSKGGEVGGRIATLEL